MITPLNNNIVVQEVAVKSEETTESGIILNNKEVVNDCKQGKVLAVGPECNFIGLEGKTVLYTHGESLYHDNAQHCVVADENVLAVIE